MAGRDADERGILIFPFSRSGARGVRGGQIKADKYAGRSVRNGQQQRLRLLIKNEMITFGRVRMAHSTRLIAAPIANKIGDSFGQF
jgi:hypothetical protein